MRFVVAIVTGDASEFMAANFLPNTPLTARAAGRVYRCYRVDGQVDQAFTDLDGAPLVELRSFETLAEAQAWVNEDILQRQALLRAEGRAQ